MPLHFEMIHQRTSGTQNFLVLFGGNSSQVAGTDVVRAFADELMAQRGVRHGKLNIIALLPETHHAHDGHGATHVHYKPAR